MAENIPVRPRRNGSASRSEAIAPKPPAHLSKESRKLYDDITTEWTIGIDGVALLVGGLEAKDAYEQCRRQLVRDGPTFKSPSGRICANPAAKLANDFFSQFRMSMRALGLDPEK